MPTGDQDFPDTGDERNRAVGPAADRERQAVLRQQVVRARAHVRRVVNAADPEGLLDLGAPADEYDPEVEDLTRLVQHGDVTTATVREIWERWFGPGSALQDNPALLEHLTQQLRREHFDTDDQVADVIVGDRLTDSSGRVWVRKHSQWLSPTAAGKLLKRGGAVARYGTTGGPVHWLQPDEAAAWWAQAKDHVEVPGVSVAPPDNAGLTYGAHLWRSGPDRLLGIQTFC
jgi:hypothetical protein